MGYFAAPGDGPAGEPRKLLDEAVRRCDISSWPYPIIKYLCGEIDESTLTAAAATDDDRLTDVHCFLGLKAASENKKDAALAHFRWVKEHGISEFLQYAISVCELDRLEGK